jgi:predicted AAA+ superfamily ATPase
MRYISRLIEPLLTEYLSFFPATAILGPRQCGKSTLVKERIKTSNKSIYLDLELESDRRKLEYPEQFFKHNANKLICLDEIQQVPDLFKSLRSIIDKDRHPGQFLILGSASRDLIRQSSETLAGRIGYLELSPFIYPEIHPLKTQKELWLQGGFPDSLFATERLSNLWRENFIRTFLERDIPQMGLSIPAGNISRLWKMLAHGHGQLLNLSNLGKSMGMSHTTVRNYIDLFNQTFMTRELKPYENNLKKRLTKSPKLYIRDTGILHNLLNIRDFNELISHPVYGFSWEGFVIENITAFMPEHKPSFYRTSHGAELDLIMESGQRKIAFEIKAADAPKLTKGFWQAVEDVKPDITYIVSPIATKYPIKENIWAIGLSDLFEELNKFSIP